MQSIPHLRTRTEYSFRTCFGPMKEVVAALNCEVAGIVDTRGTWGHVQWEKEMTKAGIGRAFGAEFEIEDEAGRKPRCWVLAENLRAFYRLTSFPPQTPAEMAEATGVIRFAGAALTDPACFDYIDLNPRSLTECYRKLALAKETGKPLVLTGDNDYPTEGDRLRYLAFDDSKKMTPQHILQPDEWREAFWFLDDETFEAAAANTREVGERLLALDLKLEAAPMIHYEGDLRALVEQGRVSRLERGHIEEWTDEYAARLERELLMIEEKDYASYFLVVADLVSWAKTKMLVGPARGSSAGSLVCYLLGITEVDPLVHNLIFERFIDVNRDDLPDIDIDFSDKKRHMVFDYLAEKYGAENIAHIGSINRMKPKSVMAHVAKKMGIPKGTTFPVINVLIEYSSGDSRFGNGLEDTLTGTAPGRDFMERYPEAAVMGDLENHASHTGVHAAGIIVSNVPITELCTVSEGVAQVDKKDAEYLNLLKIDALGLRTLGVIEDAGVVTAEELYGMKLDDPAVFDIFNKGKYSGLFQFEGAAQRRVAVLVPVVDFKQIDHVTALARPGPLGGGATDAYIRRNAGTEQVTYRHPTMEAYLGETMGVVLYQEQVMRISFEIGCMPWSVVSELRKAMSGSKGKEYFDQRGAEFLEGAKSLGMSEEAGREVWDEICSFGAWGMNKSHTVSYAMISYWCGYMKAYHPLEYAAACLRNAKDDEQVIEILRELTKEGVPYKPFDIDHSAANWAAADGKLIGGFTNLKGIGPVKAQAYIEKRKAGKLTDPDRAKIAKHQPKHQDLRPAHTMWGHIYNDPDLYNIAGRVRELADLEDNDNAVIIARLIHKERRDENETTRIQRRGGRVMEGQTLFLDLFMVDDSVSRPARIRINRKAWDTIGETIADKAIDGEDWFLIRGRWLAGFSMMSADKIKCLTNKEMFT